MDKPRRTGSRHLLPYGELSPATFERLCLWLLRAEGYTDVQHPGAAGADLGCDLAASLDGRRVVCQCKRVDRFDPRAAETEVRKILGAARHDPPDVILFIVTASLSARTRERARQTAAAETTAPVALEFWGATELDERVKRHPRIVAEFFDLATAEAGDRRAYGFDVDAYLAAIDALARREGVMKYAVPLAATVGHEGAPREVDAEDFARDWLARADSRHLAILGDYGTGKSWLCIRITRHLADRFRDDPAAPLPLLLDFRSYRDGMQVGELLSAGMLQSYGIACTVHDVLSAIEAGGIILLLDGLDEMARDTGRRSALVQFTRLGLPPAARVIVTSRTHYFLSGDELREVLHPESAAVVPVIPRFELLYLRLLDEADMADAIGRRLGAEERGRVVRFIEERYNLSELCSRPMLLGLVCQSYDTLAGLRDSVTTADMYEAYLDAWLRRELRGGRLDVEPDEVMRFFESLAISLFDAVWLSGDEYAEHVRRFAARLDLGAVEERGLARQLATSAFLSRSAGDGWGFAHRSFQEYLYARAFFRWEGEGKAQGSFRVTRIPAWQFISQLVLRRWTRATAERWIALRVSPRLDPGLSRTTLRAAAAYWLVRTPGVRIAGYDLGEIMLDSVDLQRADFSGGRLERADLHGSDLRGAVFRDADLRGADLRASNLAGADLTGTDVAGARFQGAVLTGSLGLPADLLDGRRLASELDRPHWFGHLTD